MWQSSYKYAQLPTTVGQEVPPQKRWRQRFRIVLVMLTIFLLLSYAWIGLPSMYFRYVYRANSQ